MNAPAPATAPQAIPPKPRVGFLCGGLDPHKWARRHTFAGYQCTVCCCVVMDDRR